MVARGLAWPSTTSTLDLRISVMLRKTGVWGLSRASWVSYKQQRRWVSYRTLSSTSYREDRWAGGKLSQISQVEVERDMELER